VKNVLPSGKVETHKMEWYDTEDNKGRKRYHVTPSITFDKEGKKKSQSYEEAKKSGEVYEFKSKRRAERFAAGSWKKGKDKREAMKAYRKKKRAERKAGRKKSQ
jgi:hypothetical protein